MSDFVIDGTALPFPKIDERALAGGDDPTSHVVAADWNAVCQGAVDLRTALGNATGRQVAVTATPAVTINAALAAVAVAGGGVVQLFRKQTYTIEAALTIPSSVLLDLNESTLAAGFAPAVGLADSPTNALVKIAGAVVGGGFSTTTATNKLYRGGTVVTVASTTGMTVGDWVRVESTGASTEGNGNEGISTIRRSLLKILTVDSGTQFTSSQPSQLHHDVASTVVKVTIVDSAGVMNGTIRAPGGTMAVGVLAQYARNVQLDRLRFEGLSRAGIELSAIDGYRVTQAYVVGECNAGILFDCAHHGIVRGIECAPDGLRVHANGIPRATLTFYNTSSGVIVEDGILRHGFMAIALWGCRNVQVRGILIEDYLFSDALRTRHCTNGDNISGAPLGIVMGSRTNTSYVCHNAGIILDDVQVVDCSTDNNSGFSYAFEIGDCKELLISGCQVRNRKLGSEKLRGFYFIDNYSAAVAVNLLAAGVDYGLTLATTGAQPLHAIRGYLYTQTAGDGDIANPHPIVLELTINIIPDEMSDFTIAANRQLTVVGGTVIPTSFVIRNYFSGGVSQHCDWVTIAMNKSGGDAGLAGKIYEIDETSTPTQAGLMQFKNPTGANRKCCVIVSSVGGDPYNDGSVMFVAPLPQRTKAYIQNEAAARAPGASLEMASGNNFLVYNASPTAPVARLLDYHAAGAAGLRKIGAP